MSGITDLNQLIAEMEPELQTGEFVFCTVAGNLNEYVELSPLASFTEKEGLTLVLQKSAAEEAELSFDGVFHQITLNVHSSLDAVGLTAAIAKALTEQDISANVIAAYFHDHVFVPVNKSTEAMTALRTLSADASRNALLL